jgi:hypothetical protein
MEAHGLTGARARASRLRRLFIGGTVGNERLTATTAAVLLVLLAVEGATLLSIRSMLSVHVFVGMFVIPAVLLKLASTGYRFVRYYSGHEAYRSKGPPAVLMRLLVAPAVVASTVALFSTGFALIVVGPGRVLLLCLHKASFVVWFGAMTVHVLGYALRLPRLALADLSANDAAPGAALRQGLVVGALVAGLILALATLPLAYPWVHRAYAFRNFDR